MGTKDSSRDTESHRMGSPIQGAAILLVVFIAIYLAVSGVVHGLVSPDVAAIAPDISLTLASAATGLNRPVSAGQSPASDSFEEVSEQAGSSRECRPGAATDSSTTDMDVGNVAMQHMGSNDAADPKRLVTCGVHLRERP